MLYRKMESTGDDLSILGFGCMRLASKNGRIDEERAKKQLYDAIDRGVNYVDTAWPYHGGASETFLGKVLQGDYRKKVKLATKLPQFLCRSQADMYAYLEKQLDRLKTNKIDYYLIHTLDGHSWEKMKKLGIIEFMDDIRKSGKIGHIGFSFHGQQDEFNKIVDDYDWTFCQIQYNMIDENNQAGRKGLEYATSKGLGIIIMEPLLGGMLAGDLPKEIESIYDGADVKRSNAEWALRWIWNYPQVHVLLSGMNDENHINENIRIASEAYPESFTKKENQIVQDASDTFRRLRAVECTGCQYCVPCPKNVNIPGAFELYNQRSLFGKNMTQTAMYLGRIGGMMGGEQGLARQCVDCGICVKKCPQHIDIPAELKKVSKSFETPVNRTIITVGRGVNKFLDRRAK
jgi:predicted aldo/keto reductase-like oxidoreductase